MEDFKTWSIKILIPAIVAISVKLAIQAKKGSISYFSALTSIIIGIGTAYICSDYILRTVKEELVSITIAVITIAGEKIGFYLVYKFNIESAIENFIEGLRKK